MDDIERRENHCKNAYDMKYIDVLQAQISDCVAEIVTYNQNYIANTVLSSILVAVVGFTTVSENNDLKSLFYLLPTIYSLMI